MFFMTDFVEVVVVAGLVTTLFFGGWQVPYLARDGFHFPGGAVAGAAAARRRRAAGRRASPSRCFVFCWLPDPGALDLAALPLRPADGPRLEGPACRSALVNMLVTARRHRAARADRDEVPRLFVHPRRPDDRDRRARVVLHPQPGAQRAVAGGDAVLARGRLRAARRAPGRGAADHRLRRRDHGAVPVRDHAAEPRRRGPRARARGGSRSARSRGLGGAASRARAGTRHARRSVDMAATARPAGFGGDRRRSAQSLVHATSCFAFEVTSSCSWSAMVGAVVLAQSRGGDHRMIVPIGMGTSCSSAVLFAIGVRRRAGAPQRDRDLHVDRADAERREPASWRFARSSRRDRRPGRRVLRDDRRGGRGRRRAGDHHRRVPQPRDGQRRRAERC